MVADLRAPTPTAAAVAAVPDIQDWFTNIREKQLALTDLMEEYLQDLDAQLRRSKLDLQRVNPLGLIERRRQQLDDTIERLQTRAQHILSLQNERLRGTALRLHSLSPLLTIARGYSIVRHDSDQSIVSSMQQAHPGERLTIQVQDGYIPVEVRS
jgi:exodeoxyribonuclease VII large subunit